MSLTHPQFRVFSSPMDDFSVEEMNYVEVLPDSEQIGTSQTRWELTHKSIDSFINLHRSYLLVQVKVVRGDAGQVGNDLPATAEVAISNGVSLFDRITLLCNGSVISEVNNYQIAQQVLALAEMSKDYRDNTASVYNHHTDTNLMTNADGNNAGQNTREAKAIAGLQTFYIPICSMFGFTRYMDKVFRGLRFQIQLHKADKQVSLNTVAGANGVDLQPEIYFNKVRLLMCNVVPSPAIEASINSRLNQGAVQQLRWDEVSCYKSSSITDANPRFRIASQIQSAKHLFVTIQSTATANGSYTSNTGKFEPSATTEMSVIVNNKKYPLLPYTTDFATGNGDAVRAFMALQEYKSPFKNLNDSNLLNYDDYKTTPIWYFSLSAIEPTAFSVEGQADIEIQLKFTPDANGSTIWATVLHERNAVVSGSSTQLTLQQL